MSTQSHFGITKPAAKYLAYAILVALPWLQLLLFSSIMAHPITSLTPSWSDEIIYWHEVFSLSSVGTRFGYYTINELTPPLLAFGHHGFGTLLPYALYAKLVEWNLHSIVEANALFVSIAFLLLLALTRPTLKQTIGLILFYATFWGAVLYCSSSMTELLNFAALIVYSALLARLTTQRDKALSRWIIAFTCMISFIRIIYVVLFIPIMMLHIVEKGAAGRTRRIIVCPLLWFLGAIVLFFVNSRFQSPYPEAFLYRLFSSTTPMEFVYRLLGNFSINVARYVYPLRDDFIQLFQRYFLLALLAYLFCRLRISLRSSARNNASPTSQTRTNREIASLMYYTIVFVVLLLSLLITVTTYDVFHWRDFRTLSPVLLGATIYLILLNDLKLTRIMLVANVVALLLIVSDNRTTSFFFADPERFTPPRADTLVQKVQYNQQAKNRFENTLAVEQYEKDIFLNVPAGIGITYIDHISDELQSGWVYTGSEKRLRNYILIGVEQQGFLYRRIE